MRVGAGGPTDRGRRRVRALGRRGRGRSRRPPDGDERRTRGSSGPPGSWRPRAPVRDVLPAGGRAARRPRRGWHRPPGGRAGRGPRRSPHGAPGGGRGAVRGSAARRSRSAPIAAPRRAAAAQRVEDRWRRPGGLGTNPAAPPSTAVRSTAGEPVAVSMTTAAAGARATSSATACAPPPSGSTWSSRTTSGRRCRGHPAGRGEGVGRPDGRAVGLGRESAQQAGAHQGVVLDHQHPHRGCALVRHARSRCDRATDGRPVPRGLERGRTEAQGMTLRTAPGPGCGFRGGSA